MVKRIIPLSLALLAAVLLTGCWDYRGLDSMAIVIGMSIDKNPENDNYMLGFEVIDLTENVKEQGVSSFLLESEGKTLFEATRNVKRKIAQKLYFGHMQTLVLSEDLVKNEDIGGIIDWFLRSSEFRETLTLVISQQKTAQEILRAKGLGSKINALEIQKSAQEDAEHTSSAVYAELYDIYNTLESGGHELAMPAVHNIKNDEDEVTELNGTAVFKQQRLIGYLSSAESMSLLFVLGDLRGGILTFSSRDGEADNVSLEISKNTTNTSFSYNEGVLAVEIKTDTTAFLYEIDEPFDALDQPRVFALETQAQDTIEQNISALIKKVQKDFGADIFGFGKMISQADPALWKTLSKDWDELFAGLDVKVIPKVHIANSASVKRS